MGLQREGRVRERVLGVTKEPQEEDRDSVTMGMYREGRVGEGVLTGTGDVGGGNGTQAAEVILGVDPGRSEEDKKGETP